ncbi:hypothetical protein N7512_000134 [Penicillium capsulatum]|nr:hypothetical protein N7512_000134 [Penicillium capsulatum]
MFDVPEAKRVRRNEVVSPSSSRSPSPPDETDLQDAHARLGKLLDLDGLIGADTTNQDTKNETAGIENAEDEEEQEFEFRLFSAPTKPVDTTAKVEKDDKPATGKDKHAGDRKSDSGATQKLRIRLRSPTPVPGEGRFVKAFRGWEYYFSTPSLLGQPENDEYQATKTRQFEDIALNGQQVMEMAKSPWPGCDLSWRVIRLKRRQTKLPPKDKDVPIYVVEGAPPSKSPKTRKKPGKKRRLQLRKRIETAQKAKESEAEKRNRKNRERKMKRREKARKEKAAAAGATGDVIMAGEDGSSSAGDE